MRVAKRIVLIAIATFSTFFIFYRQYQTPPISHLLKQIPVEEQEALDWFLRMAIAGDTFGYVLFGQKPLSVSVFGEPTTKPYWIEDWIDHIPSTFCCDNLKTKGEEKEVNLARKILKNTLAWINCLNHLEMEL